MSTKKKKKLTTKPSTKLRPITKASRVFFYEMYHLKQVSIPTEFFDRISPQLIDWATNNPNADKLSKFFSKLGIHMDQVAAWSKKHPQFKAAVAQAKQLIGDRRHDMITKDRDINPGLLMYTQAFYDQDAATMMRTRAELKAKTEEKPTEIKIIVPDLLEKK